MDQPIWQKRFTKVCFLPMRIVVTTMGFFALVCAFTNRVSIAFVIIELAVPKNRTDSKSSGICPPESDLTKEKMQILICASTPDKHLCIRKGEKDYLKKHISMQTESLTIPWHKILFSKALIALAISQIGHDWAFCLIVSYLPKYMADVLQFSILSNGLWTSLPFVALWFSSLICGFLADWLIRTGTMSITVERKVFTFISAFGPGAFMVIASYVECRKSLAVLFFTLSMFMMGPFYAGQKLTPIDMSPTYAGILTAICNGAGAVSGLLCPSIIGIMTPDRTTGQWRYVFWLSFAISVSSAIVFALWGSSDLQAYDPRAQRIRRRTKSHIPLDVFA
ncbi:sialin-like isoform X3 [Drosophila hydei]|uniref:Sialin-like isoform X3 n=1 Tax=Drosophila hydei TaxID=7224 RepID=A0A6J1LB80_DROHY|nr:sialin-like isoform X3 [Drosophila hydei]